MQNFTMPAGTYFIGDLCYVMSDVWDKVFSQMESTNFTQGTITVDENIVGLHFSTVFGDGIYYDEDGHKYPVDSGSIGCINLESITDPSANLLLGRVFEFKEPFECFCGEGDILYFGKICIDTN